MTSEIEAAELGVLSDKTRDHRRKIPALTGIRGYASLWVVMHHCVNLGYHKSYGTWPTTTQLFVFINGYLGVDLFFILSGFVLIKTYGSRVVSWSGLREFIIGRVFRIIPIYWLSLIAFALVTPLMDGRWLVTEDHSVANWFLSSLLIQSWVKRPTVWNAPGWSLSAEWLAYVGFPVLAIVFARLRRPVVMIGIAITSLFILRLCYNYKDLTSLSNVGTFGLARCLCEFTIGVALGRLHQIGWTGARMGNVLLGVGLLTFLPPMVDERFDFLAILAFALLVLSAGSQSRYAHALFGNRIVHFLGEISFSIYILHWLLLELAFRFVPGPTPLVVALVAVPVVVVPLAWATWRWIEVPGQAAGRVVIARLRARDADHRLDGIERRPAMQQARDWAE